MFGSSGEHFEQQSVGGAFETLFGETLGVGEERVRLIGRQRRLGRGRSLIGKRDEWRTGEIEPSRVASVASGKLRV